MNRKDLIAIIYLKSGNRIDIMEDLNNINARQTLNYFEKVIERFKDTCIQPSSESTVGYFRYGGTIVALSSIEAISIQDMLYCECGVVSSSNHHDAFLSNKSPKTEGDLEDGLIVLGE